MGHRAHSRFLAIAGGWGDNGIYSAHGYPHRIHGYPDVCHAITDSLHTGRADVACSSSFPVCYRFQVHNVHTFSQNALGDDFFWDTQNHTKRDRFFGNVSKSAASHSPEPLKAGGDFYFGRRLPLGYTKPPKAHIHRPAVKRQGVIQAGMHKIERDVVYLFTCVPVYLCTCVPVYLCTCVPVYLCTCVPVYLCTCVPVYLCTCVPVYLCTCVPVYLCTCVPVYLCTWVPVYLCTCESCEHVDRQIPNPSDFRLPPPHREWYHSERRRNNVFASLYEVTVDTFVQKPLYKYKQIPFEQNKIGK